MPNASPEPSPPVADAVNAAFERKWENNHHLHSIDRWVSARRWFRWGWDAALSARGPQSQQPPPDVWVSVDERMPKDHETVFVFTDYRNRGGLTGQHEAYHVRGIWRQRGTDNALGNVTHWTPLLPDPTATGGAVPAAATPVDAVDCRCAKCGKPHFEGDCTMDPTYEERHVTAKTFAATSAAGEAPTPAVDLANELHALAMNTPCEQSKAGSSGSPPAYKAGHRDARHAIAEALIAHPTVGACRDQGHRLRQLEQNLADNERSYNEAYMIAHAAKNDAAALREENERLRAALAAFREPMRRYKRHSSWTKGDENMLLAAAELADAALATAGPGPAGEASVAKDGDR